MEKKTYLLSGTSQVPERTATRVNVFWSYTVPYAIGFALMVATTVVVSLNLFFTIQDRMAYDYGAILYQCEFVPAKPSSTPNSEWVDNACSGICLNSHGTTRASGAVQGVAYGSPDQWCPEMTACDKYFYNLFATGQASTGGTTALPGIPNINAYDACFPSGYSRVIVRKTTSSLGSYVSDPGEVNFFENTLPTSVAEASIAASDTGKTVAAAGLLVTSTSKARDDALASSGIYMKMLKKSDLN